MRIRTLTLLAVVGAAALPARAADAKATPTLVVRVGSVDGLIADARYLAEAAGKGNEAKQFEGIIRSFGDGKSIEGFDTTKPIALYGRLATKIEQSDLVLMLPVADEKAVLALLDRVGVKAEKEKDAYKVPKVPFPGYFRFANGYVYATIGDVARLDKDRLLAPAAVFPGKTGPLEISLDITQVPDGLKTVLIGQASLRIGEAKGKKRDNETDAQYQFRVAAADELAMQIKAIVNEGKDVTVKVQVDRQNAEVVVSARFTAKPGTKLAEAIGTVGQGKSITASLTGPGSALSVRGYAALPPTLHKAAEALFEETLTKVKDAAPAELSDLVKAFGPTVKAGELDLGFDLRGPAADGRFNGVAALGVKDGGQIDKAIRALHAIAPAEVRDHIKLDAEKAAGVNIIRVAPPADMLNPEIKRVFGDGPIYVAIRKDAIFVSAGDKALDNMKEVLGREPKAGKLLQADVSVARVVALDKKPDAVAIAKKVFGKDPTEDKVRLTVEGGKALEVRLSAKAKLLDFVLQVNEARPKGER